MLTLHFLPGVSVTIPEGAIKKGTSEEIFLAVCRDDKDRPKLTGKSLCHQLKVPVLVGITGMVVFSF